MRRDERCAAAAGTADRRAADRLPDRVRQISGGLERLRVFEHGNLVVANRLTYTRLPSGPTVTPHDPLPIGTDSLMSLLVLATFSEPCFNALSKLAM